MDGWCYEQIKKEVNEWMGGLTDILFDKKQKYIDKEIDNGQMNE